MTKRGVLINLLQATTFQMILNLGMDDQMGLPAPAGKSRTRKQQQVVILNNHIITTHQKNPKKKKKKEEKQRGGMSKATSFCHV